MIFKLGNSIKKADYHKTKLACYMGFITQAIAANFAPLLFLKFHSDYHISLGNIALISTFFFFTLFISQISAYSKQARITSIMRFCCSTVILLSEGRHRPLSKISAPTSITSPAI